MKDESVDKTRVLAKFQVVEMSGKTPKEKTVSVSLDADLVEAIIGSIVSSQQREAELNNANVKLVEAQTEDVKMDTKWKVSHISKAARE